MASWCDECLGWCLSELMLTQRVARMPARFRARTTCADGKHALERHFLHLSRHFLHLFANRGRHQATGLRESVARVTATAHIDRLAPARPCGHGECGVCVRERERVV